MAKETSHRLSQLTLEEFARTGLELSKEANVLDGLHGYFVQQCPRLFHAFQLFGLFEKDLGDVLEIGAFFGYAPFVLKENASSYTVLEGDDPTVHVLKPMYEKRGIAMQLTDLFELFGPTHGATHRLPFADASFDTILCWETMEHFSFNPVKFVRELNRVLKPGGKACITVPNKASFQNIVALLSGRAEKAAIDAYYQFEDYTSNGKKAFYGFHWREYTCPEMAQLFTKAGFAIQKCGTFVAFHAFRDVSPVRKLARVVSRIMGGILPRYGTNVCLIAAKEPLSTT